MIYKRAGWLAVSHDRNDYGRRSDQSGRTRHRDEPEHGIEVGSKQRPRGLEHFRQGTSRSQNAVAKHVALGGSPPPFDRLPARAGAFSEDIAAPLEFQA